MPTPLDSNLVRAAARLTLYRRDFPTFARQQLKIATKAATISPFVLRPYQQKLHDQMMAQAARQGHVRQLWLKSRQLGTSTLTQGLAFWRTVLNPYTNTIVVAHDEGTAQTIFNMSRRFHDNLERSLKPMVKYSTKRELVFSNPSERSREEIPGLNSQIFVATARNMHSGAGGTHQFCHLSEAARYQNPKEIESSTLQTVPLAPNTYVIVESTARPEGFWFRELCDQARAGRGDYEFHFVSWLEDPSCQATPPPDFEPESDERDLMEKYGITPAQIVWRRSKLGEMLGDEASFNMDYPLEYDDAWITRETSVFPIPHMQGLLAGLSIPRFRCDLMPRGKIMKQEDGPLSVWREPEAGAIYDIGADVALGVGRDWSTAIVLRRPTGEQVAEYRAQIEPGEFADILASLGYYYGGCQIACEANSIGAWVNSELVKKYPNVYVWRRPDRLDQRPTKFAGFETTLKTKKHLIARGKDCVYRWVTEPSARESYPLIRSEMLWREMKTFVQTPGTDVFGGAPGNHDDLVMAWLIAVYAAYEDQGFMMDGQAPEEAPKIEHLPGCTCRSCEPSLYMTERERNPRAQDVWADVEAWSP